jgi:hypothetical protein
MKFTVVGLALAVLTVALAEAQSGAVRFAHSATVPLYGIGLFLVGLASSRPFAVAVLGELRRRRAFEPKKVREVPSPMPDAIAMIVVMALVGVVLTYFPAWNRAVDPASLGVVKAGPVLLWTLAPVLGLVGGLWFFGGRRESGLQLSSTLASGIRESWATLFTSTGGVVGTEAAKVLSELEQDLASATSEVGRSVAGLSGWLPEGRTAIRVAIGATGVLIAAVAVSAGVWLR